MTQTQHPEPDHSELIKRLTSHLDKTKGAVVVSRDKRGYAAASEWGQEAPDSPMAGGAAYGMGDSPAQALGEMLTEAGS